ncbi:hypothetical protein PIROE2DRAFT_8902 [Piromyces sp. E2]|nr:hypothetical protein PIROE2DRAFT_8902 [Piromyces sp. E2]|eukprot:OUM64348.1 hypothetical protein PIROE2DRAFT_8902 [Piromyces sp. E2]
MINDASKGKLLFYSLFKDIVVDIILVLAEIKEQYKNESKEEGQNYSEKAKNEINNGMRSSFATPIENLDILRVFDLGLVNNNNNHELDGLNENDILNNKILYKEVARDYSINIYNEGKSNAEQIKNSNLLCSYYKDYYKDIKSEACEFVEERLKLKKIENNNKDLKKYEQINK